MNEAEYDFLRSMVGKSFLLFHFFLKKFNLSQLRLYIKLLIDEAKYQNHCILLLELPCFHQNIEILLKGGSFWDA